MCLSLIRDTMIIIEAALNFDLSQEMGVILHTWQDSLHLA